MGHSHSLDDLVVLMLSVSPSNELELMKGCQRNREVIVDSPLPITLSPFPVS